MARSSFLTPAPWAGGIEYTSAPWAAVEPTTSEGTCQYTAPLHDWSGLDARATQGWNVNNAFLVLKPDFQIVLDQVQCGGTGCASCGSGGDTPGKVTTATGSLDVQISLGPDNGGKPAGYFHLHAEQWSAALLDPASLAYSSIWGAGFAMNGGVVWAPNATAYVLPTTAGYGLFFTNQDQEFLASVTIESNSLPNQMVITEVLGLNGSPRVLQFNYTGTGPNSWTWTRSKATGCASNRAARPGPPPPTVRTRWW